MTVVFEVGPYWLLLTGLHVTMVHGGGIEWIHRRDTGRFSHVPVTVWKRVHHPVWLIGTFAFAIGLLLI